MDIASLKLWDSQFSDSHIVREIDWDSPIHPFNQENNQLLWSKESSCIATWPFGLTQKWEPNILGDFTLF